VKRKVKKALFPLILLVKKTFLAFCAVVLFLWVFAAFSFAEPKLLGRDDSVVVVTGQSRADFPDDPLGDGVSDAVKAYIDARNRGWNGIGNPEDFLGGQGGLPYATPGVYYWPVKGSYQVISVFGTSRGGGTRLHDGIDVYGREGVSPIVAISSGIVVNAVKTDSGNCGLQVSYLTDSGLYVTNCHMDSVASGIYSGKKLNACEVIGTVGKSGNARSTAPHLHIQIKSYGASSAHSNYYDPLKSPISFSPRLNCDNPIQQEPVSYSSGSCPKSNGCTASAEVSSAIFKYSQKWGVDPILVCHQAAQESCYSPRSTSGAGAIGVMQIMPATGRSSCSLSVSELRNIEKNVECGVRYLKAQLERFGGNMRFALAAYNAGPGRVIQYGGVPPASFAHGETYYYVRNICNRYGKC
jgi:hypothetical protein